MENFPFTSIDQVNDINTRDEYEVALKAGLSPEEALAAVSYYSRDNARTPFQWDDSPNAGFTGGTPWLPVNPNYRTINAQAQIGNPDSVFSFYQKLINLRKDPAYADTIIYGVLEPYLADTKGLMAFYRRGEEQTLLVLANFQKEEQAVSLPAPYKNVICNNYDTMAFAPGSSEENPSQIQLKNYQAVVLEL